MKIRIYGGKSEKPAPGTLHSTDVVLDLLDGYVDKGMSGVDRGDQMIYLILFLLEENIAMTQKIWLCSYFMFVCKMRTDLFASKIALPR
ncbi:hypothetical protein EVAR_64040_1 [Eumeta japonica]|uniref:Uncharacterized protein n=1 Tax=Eumeta variegata TaxID=151549 RepID=A0A4C1Z2E6_EUMVA|nr:hypothetical protein EVAR_64040_1 [Eumeta japonica]